MASACLFNQLVRPLQTLANIVAALREDDFSFRAHGARRGDSLGNLALETNSVAGTLQHQRASARDALTVVEQVMTSMQSPVLAIDPSGNLRLLNKRRKWRSARLAARRSIVSLLISISLPFSKSAMRRFTRPPGTEAQPSHPRPAGWSGALHSVSTVSLIQ